MYQVFGIIFFQFFIIGEMFSQLPSKIDIKWVEIPAGSFVMGSPTNEVGRDHDEIQHEVFISSFYVSKFEITYDQYIFFCKTSGYKKPDSDGQNKGSYPIVNVDWNDAVAFANWLGVRLLTEAEWEYVCRAGSQTPFCFGNVITSTQVNFDGNYPYNHSPKSKSKGETMPVGSYHPNKWGVYDMHGNVWEWVSDWYAPYNLEVKNNPTGPKESKFERLGRGGSFYEGGNENRCADRGAQTPNVSGMNLGFRVAKNF
jgi:sulfatase modifying factor 1